MYARLLAAPAVQALLAGRVYPVRLAQGAALPAVAYQQIGRPASAAARGCRLPEAVRVQVSLFARTYAELDALDAAVRAALDGHQDPADGIAAVRYLDGRDQMDDQSLVYYRPTDYRVELT